MKRLFAIIAGLLLAMGVWVASTQAHALLARSIPAANSRLNQPPAVIEMWFSEPLEQTFTAARLLNAAGQEIQTGPATIDPADASHMSLPAGNLGPGNYTVDWQTLSQVDGHEWYGSFPFTVLNSDGSLPGDHTETLASGNQNELPAPAEVAVRWLTLVGGMLLLGVSFFRLFVAASSANGNDLSKNADTPAITLIWLAVFMLVAGDVSQFLLQLFRLGGLDQLPDLLLGTRVVRLAIARQLMASTAFLVVLAMPQPGPLRNRERKAFLTAALYPILLILLLWLGQERDTGNLVLPVFLVVAVVLSLAGWLAKSEEARGKQRQWAVVVLAATATLYTLSASSHAGAVPGSALATLADYIHLLAAGVWLGGLTLLALLLWSERRKSDDQGATRRLQIVKPFSFLASFSVFVLVLTGLFNSLVELPTWQSLWSTSYGRVLFVKLVLVQLALTVAFFNNYIVHRAGRNLPPAEKMRRLKRQILVEVSVAALLLVSVAVLVRTPPPRSLASQQPLGTQQPFNTLTDAGDLTIHSLISPNQIGNNRFWLHLFRSDGTDIGEVQLVRLLFDYQDAELGQASLDLPSSGQNTFSAEGTNFNQPGTWQLSAYIRRRGMDDLLAPFTVEVPEISSAIEDRDPWQYPIPSIQAPVVIGVLMAAAGLTPVLWQEPLRTLVKQRYPILRLGGIVLAAGGLLVLLLALISLLSARISEDALLSRTNPIPASADSLEAGRALYQKNCLSCHGPTGEGDGPLGLTLIPPPANLQVHMVPGVHADGQIFEWINNGLPDTPMPAFGDRLTESERWHIINYIRTLVPGD